MMSLLQELLREESGQDTIEYVFIGIIVALGALAGMGTLATKINTEFGNLANDLT